MTVAELIKVLEAYPKDMVVTIPGFDGGYRGEICPIEVVTVCDAGKDSWLWGRYDRPEPDNLLPRLEIVALGGRGGQFCP